MFSVRDLSILISCERLSSRRMDPIGVLAVVICNSAFACARQSCSMAACEVSFLRIASRVQEILFSMGPSISQRIGSVQENAARARLLNCSYPSVLAGRAR